MSDLIVQKLCPTRVGIFSALFVVTTERKRTSAGGKEQKGRRRRRKRKRRKRGRKRRRKRRRRRKKETKKRGEGTKKGEGSSRCILADHNTVYTSHVRMVALTGKSEIYKCMSMQSEMYIGVRVCM